MSDIIEFIHAVKSIKDIDIQGKRVLIRTDFNVHLDSGFNILNDNRIKNALNTINYCIDNNAKQIILVSHLGSVDGNKENSSSLRHVLKRLEKLLNKKVIFIEDFISQKSTFENLSDSQVILFENLRFFKEERLNDDEFSKKLAACCDVYVNDSFGTSHNKHASVYGITNYVEQKVAGFALLKELHALFRVLKTPTKPFTLVLGGKKISTKIALLHNIMKKVDKIVIGGAIGNTFLKAMGYNMQDSPIEDDYVHIAQNILKDASLHDVKIYLPIDCVVTDSPKTPQTIKSVTVQEIPQGFASVDIGPASVILFDEVIDTSNTIIWNGPMGMYENEEFFHGTYKVAEAVANSFAYTIIGGSDTAKAVEKAWDKEDFSFISSGGAATLELLEGRMLPGLQNIDRSSEDEL
jgi:phosphoglycerate kinase